MGWPRQSSPSTLSAPQTSSHASFFDICRCVYISILVFVIFSCPDLFLQEAQPWQLPKQLHDQLPKTAAANSQSPYVSVVLASHLAKTYLNPHHLNLSFSTTPINVSVKPKFKQHPALGLEVTMAPRSVAVVIVRFCDLPAKSAVGPVFKLLQKQLLHYCRQLLPPPRIIKHLNLSLHSHLCIPHLCCIPKAPSLSVAHSRQTEGGGKARVKHFGFHPLFLVKIWHICQGRCIYTPDTPQKKLDKLKNLTGVMLLVLLHSSRTVQSSLSDKHTSSNAPFCLPARVCHRPLQGHPEGAESQLGQTVAPPHLG